MTTSSLKMCFSSSLEVMGSYFRQEMYCPFASVWLSDPGDEAQA